MASIAYAAPLTAPADPEPSRVGLPMTWAAKGAEFTLSDRRTGLYLRPGVRGLGSTTTERRSSSSPAVAGSRFQGVTTMDREVFWPLRIFHGGGSAAWMARDRAFWATMDPEDTGVWTVNLPDGSRRSLRLRFVTDGDHTFDRDPVRAGWATYGITLVAEQPYWTGETVRKSWAQGDMRDFYVTDAARTANGYPAGTIHYLSSGGALGSATFSNDGDVPAYPVWTVVGPTTAVSFGVGGNDIIVPFEIPAGYAVQLDTDPVTGQVLWYGAWDPSAKKITAPVDRTSELNPASAFVSIPKGQDRPLTIQMTGTGTVIADVTNRYRRAW